MENFAQHYEVKLNVLLRLVQHTALQGGHNPVQILLAFLSQECDNLGARGYSQVCEGVKGNATCNVLTLYRKLKTP